MRRNVTAVPQGDSLCLFCASRILGTRPCRPRLSLRAPRRTFHSQNRLGQASGAARTEVPGNDRSASTNDTQGGDADVWGSADGGWGSEASSSVWGSKAKVLGKIDEQPAAQQSRQQAISTRSQGTTWGPQQQQQRQDRSNNAQRGGFQLRKVGLQNVVPPQEQPLNYSPRSDSTLRKQPGGPGLPAQGPRATSDEYSFQIRNHRITSERPSEEARIQEVPREKFAFRKQKYEAGSSAVPTDRIGSASGISRSYDRFSLMKREAHPNASQNDRPGDLNEKAGPPQSSWGTTTPVARKQTRSWMDSEASTLDHLGAVGDSRMRRPLHDDYRKEVPRGRESGESSAGARGDEAVDWRIQRKSWQHLPAQPTGFRRPIQQSSEPTPTNPDLERFKMERAERMRQARDGEVVSWNSEATQARETGGYDESTAHLDSTSVSDAQSSQPRVQRRIARFEESRSQLDRRSQRANDMKRMNRMGRSSGRPEDEDIDERALLRMEQREKRKADKAKKKAESPPTPIVLPEFISIGNLAAALHVRDDAFARKLEELGFENFSNDHILDAENAGLIAQELNFEPTIARPDRVVEDLVAAPEPAPEDRELMLNRPPVITIMGHVDHGKTTLLDYLRKSSVAAGEHGGITQHIGAFTVEMSSGRTITFLDTPGHSAFLEMRQRGANVTDIVILVVAADDSVKPQTLEAIRHAQGAGVPMIVAMSKIDKDDANPERVKRDLASNGVEVEDFGGEVQAIPVSGKTGQGMEDLEDAAIALADVLDVRADTAGAVEGWVLESKLKPQGRVATVLMKRGTLRPGVILVAGTTFTRVRTLRNEAGQTVSEATPGQPIEVDGWDDTPGAGAEALEAPNMQRVREVCDLRRQRLETERLAQTISTTNEQREAHRTQRAITKEQAQILNRGEVDEERSAELQAAADLAASNATSKFIQAPVIVRGDVAGSVEAVSAAVLAMGNNDIRARILREEVGAITGSDIELASISKGIIINFGLTIPGEIRRAAGKSDVKIVDGNIIYRITDAVKQHLEELLPPIRTPRVLGEADIAMVFEYKMKDRGMVPVAGCKVTNGTVEKGKNVKVFRAGQVVYDGILSSLKNQKKDVDSMPKGTDCGMSFEKFTEFEAGDKVQSYEIHEERRKL